MKKASNFLKHVFSAVITSVKAKSIAVKSKTSSFKTRLLIFGLLQNKKVLMRAINHKIHALIGNAKDAESEDYSKAIVLYNADDQNEELPSLAQTELADYEEGENDYPDLRHSLFDLDDEDDDDGLANATGSVIELIKNSKDDSSNFCLEDEIDHVADVFIKRFHRQMRMQKLESFKRYQDMLQRGVQ